MKPERVAELVTRAAYHKVSLCWIAKHPVLLLGESALPGHARASCNLVFVECS